MCAPFPDVSIANSTRRQGGEDEVCDVPRSIGYHIAERERGVDILRRSVDRPADGEDHGPIRSLHIRCKLGAFQIVSDDRKDNTILTRLVLLATDENDRPGHVNGIRPR